MDRFTIKAIAYEFHNYKTGHCYVDYIAQANKGVCNGYTKKPLAYIK